MSTKLSIYCSPEQLDVIEDHLLYQKPLGIQPDERHWMLGQARKVYPNCKITAANLDLANGRWDLDLDVSHNQQGAS